MSAEAMNPQLQWDLLVRRSFGISDVVAHTDAREELIGCFQVRLHENGWDSASRGIAEPVVDALMQLDGHLRPDELPHSASVFASREVTYRLLESGMSVVDPEHLVFDSTLEYPAEIVAAAQQTLDRIGQYTREQALAD